jgi:hypothetical protein
VSEREVEWVRNKTHVDANYASGPGYPHSSGEVIAYASAPQVRIRRKDGTTFWWRADLCTETPPTEGET